MQRTKNKPSVNLQLRLTSTPLSLSTATKHISSLNKKNHLKSENSFLELFVPYLSPTKTHKRGKKIHLKYSQNLEES